MINLKNRILASIRARRSRISPVDIAGVGRGKSILAEGYALADQLRKDPDALSWSMTGVLPKSRKARLWDGKYKCNAFVQQGANKVFGDKTILQHPKLGRTMSAGEIYDSLANPTITGKGTKLVPITKDQANLLPGSIVVSKSSGPSGASGHVGVTSGFNRNTSISAGSANGVVENDWGFRPGEDYRYGSFVPSSLNEPAIQRLIDRRLSLARKLSAIRTNEGAGKESEIFLRLFGTGK